MLTERGTSLTFTLTFVKEDLYGIEKIRLEFLY